MSNDMCGPADLAHLPGAPFTAAEVDAAVAAVRNIAGWRIAPDDEETFTLDVGDWETQLRIPTRKLVAVDEIRDTDTDDVIASSSYRVSVNQGLIEHRAGYWPAGFGRVEVDVTHGFESVPPELLTVVAAQVAKTRRTHSVQAQNDANTNPDLLYGDSEYHASVLERYSLWYCPGMA